jgi:riboflavin kinase/FMN adenylyltransferase
MQEFDSVDSAALRGVYLAVGSFDGLHRGHRRLLDRMIQAAEEDGAPPAVLTFFPHPRAVLAPASAPPFRYLTTLEERLSLLRGLPLEAIILQPFDRAFSGISASEFLSTLKKRLDLRAFWCGPSFSFGHRREGNAAYLSEKSLALGFSLHVVPPLVDSEGPISSTRIRRALADGDPAKAARILGRRYALSGTVVHGAGRGRTMGTPTANIGYWPELALPEFGVYATWAVHEGRRYAGATSVGLRPTFDTGSEPAVTVETHLLDFHGDLYGSTLGVEFVACLRPERRFPDKDSLRAQMATDIEQVRRILQEER